MRDVTRRGGCCRSAPPRPRGRRRAAGGDDPGVGRSSSRWIVVGVSTAINALAWGVRSTFALFYVAMLAELAWGRGAAAFGYSLSWLCFALFAPVAGWLFDRLGIRLIVCISGVLLGAAIASTGHISSLAQYYVCFGVLGAAGMAGMIIPSTTIVTRWFTGSRGTAMGVLSAGTSIGAIVFYPVTAWLIATLGWRSALLVFGCALAVATVSLALLYRDPPAAEGPVSRDTRATPVEGPQVAGAAWTLRRALGSTRLWAAFTMTALGVIGYQIMATHQVAHAVDRGLPQPTVVWLFALGAGCMMAGNLLGGWLSDHVGRGRVFAGGTVVAIAGIGCLAVMRGLRTCGCSWSTPCRASGSACASRSSRPFRPTPLPARISEPSWASSRRAAGSEAPSARFSAAGCSTSPGATTSRSPRPVLPSRDPRWRPGSPPGRRPSLPRRDPVMP